MGHELKIVVPVLMVSLLAVAPNVLSAEKHECGYCHMTSDKMQFRSPLAELCLQCHPGRKSPNEHKVDIVPSIKVVGLPLSKDGAMTCITCHDPHGESGYPMLLRADPSQLCSRCHLM